MVSSKNLNEINHLKKCTTLFAIVRHCFTRFYILKIVKNIEHIFFIQIRTHFVSLNLNFILVLYFDEIE